MGGACKSLYARPPPSPLDLTMARPGFKQATFRMSGGGGGGGGAIIELTELILNFLLPPAVYRTVSLSTKAPLKCPMQL